MFGRWVASLTVDGTPAPVPANEPGLDWEGEVAAIVGRQLTDVDEATARAGVLGYAAFNDLTARTAQKLTAQWTLGKNADRSGPIGPIVTADEVGDLADGLRVQTRVNGEVVQDGTTRDMIFGVGDLLSRISRTFTLNPGDVIATGTPMASDTSGRRRGCCTPATWSRSRSIDWESSERRSWAPRTARE